MSSFDSWENNAHLNLTSDNYRQCWGKGEASLTALEALLESGYPMNDGALSTVMTLFEQTLSAALSIRATCRAYESVHPNGVLSSKDRSRLASLLRRLRLCASKISLNLTPQSPTAKLFSSGLLESLDTLSAQNTHPLDEIGVPLSLNSLYRHLVSTMRVEVRLNGQTFPLSHSQVIQVLKSHDDPQFVRATFNACNAWCSQYSRIFADLLNLTLEYKITRSSAHNFDDVLRASLRQEHVSRATYEALFKALDEKKSTLQKTITYRSAYLRQPRLHAANILSANPGLPFSSFGPFQSYETTLAALNESYQSIDPRFTQFLEEEQSEHWIDAAHTSSKVGGTWCEDYPTQQRSVIFANYSTGLAGAFQLAHPLGVGFLYVVLHRHQVFPYPLPFSMLETGGQFALVLLSNWLSKNSSSKEDSLSFEWFSLRVLANKLLLLPLRHRLMRRLITHRFKDVLSVDLVNIETQKEWQATFGQTVESFDQYLWILKPHFYRTDVFFYDWQYVFGYLMARFLHHQLQRLPQAQKATALESFFQDMPFTSFEAICQKHFGAQIDRKEFWLEAIDLSLSPAKAFAHRLVSSPH